MKINKNSPSECGELSDRFLRKLMNTKPEFSRGECRITFEVGRGLLIEGVKSVCDYSDSQIILTTFSRNIVIEGGCLCICRMMQESMVICGSIYSIKMI